MHASIVLLAIGIVGSSSYSSEKDVQLEAGRVGHGRRRTRSPSAGSSGATSSNANEIRAVIDVSGRSDGTLKTGHQQLLQRRHVARGRDPHELAARRGHLRDLRPARSATGAVFFKVLVKPLVNLIWIAGFVFLFGSLVALWPDAREQRRLIARLALARA